MREVALAKDVHTDFPMLSQPPPIPPPPPPPHLYLGRVGGMEAWTG